MVPLSRHCGLARRRPVIFTANYGEAGAIDRYGPALGLPPSALVHRVRAGR
jgi:hypothetical protein